MQKLSGSVDPLLPLSAALASNAVQEGHVCVDLAEYAMQPVAFDNPPAPADRWPDLVAWTDALAASPMVGSSGDYRPLVLCGSRLYLYRYWDYEQRLLARLRDFCTGIARDFDHGRARAALAALFPGPCDRQKIAAAIALAKRFCLISGGPGTGKTSTVLRIAALFATVYEGNGIRIALAAPTGKAAARLEEAVNAGRDALPCSIGAAALIPTEARTIHGLLRPLPDSPFLGMRRITPCPMMP